MKQNCGVRVGCADGLDMVRCDGRGRGGSGDFQKKFASLKDNTVICAIVIECAMLCSSRDASSTWRCPPNPCWCNDVSMGQGLEPGPLNFRVGGRQGRDALWTTAACLFRLPLPLHHQSMPLRFNASCCCIKPRLSFALQPSLRSLQSSSIVLRRNCLPQRWSADHARAFAAMAPKQATLGYVKSSQTTLGCGDTL